MSRCKKIKPLLSILVFLLLFFPALSRCTLILADKNHTLVAPFYNEKRNSLDVLFVGSSHAYHGITPMEIWHEYGIPGYVLGSASQTIPLSYFLIKEGIRTQHPKVIVLEAFGSYYKKDYKNAGSVHHAIDAIPYNLTKLEIFCEFLPRTLSLYEEMEYIFPVSIYHDRWDSLTENDYNGKPPYMKGHTFSFRAKPFTEPRAITTAKAVSEGTATYFEKIVALCRKTGTQLLILQVPSADGKTYKYTHKRTNTLFEMAKEAGVPVVDFEVLREDCPFDYSADFSNATHMNTLGAEKVSHWLGAYLKEQYELPDRREDPAYSDWNNDYELYRAHRDKLMK